MERVARRCKAHVYFFGEPDGTASPHSVDTWPMGLFDKDWLTMADANLSQGSAVG